MENNEHFKLDYTNPDKFWPEFRSEAVALMVPEILPNLANLSALIFDQMPDLNWAGFYLYDGVKLVLGPFQGRTACVYIDLNKGVCGAAARSRQTQIVADVHAFPGHIACDARSRSELVIPVLKADGSLHSVLDLDSPKLARFSQRDADELNRVLQACLGLIS